MTLLCTLRGRYHARILKTIMRCNGGIWNNADSGSKSSVAIAAGVAGLIQQKTGGRAGTDSIKVQNVGKEFEKATMDFLREGFSALGALRPGAWQFARGKKIAEFYQYAHLAEVAAALKQNRGLRAAFSDYIVKPDIIVSRAPEPDNVINAEESIVPADGKVAAYAPLREQNNESEILHASISCKWTLRSDRSQHARTEALNLLRNRKGGTPHIAFVTAEPMPLRIATVALGTGDIDCVYHFALAEMLQVAAEVGNETDKDTLQTLVEGNRLRDISDLPLDLAA
ncbi:MAG: NgoMIV family type II restriction endonuclease [Gammaproteobacteria bacterium]